MIYLIIFVAGFMSGMMFVVVDTVGYAVVMKLSELEVENENLKTEIEMLKDKYDVKDA